MEVIIRPTAGSAADLIAGILGGALRGKADLPLGLATGNTMESVYARLVRMHREDGLDFSRCRTFNLDEYVGLLASHSNSYRHYMNEQLFRHVNIDLTKTT